jgi:drug/metabolite transporter (DMT)-like permease
MSRTRTRARAPQTVRPAAPHWSLIFLFAVFMTAPNTMLIRVLADSLDGATIAAVRYTVTALILLPFFIHYLRRRHSTITRRRLLKLFLLVTPMAFGASLLSLAISYSNASYIAVLIMLTPIVFTILSTLLTHDRITRRALAGLMLAILGGITVIVLPILLNQPLGFFGAVPLILIAFYILIDASFPIFLRREHESGLPMPVILFASFATCAVVSNAVAIGVHGLETYAAVPTLGWQAWAIILYLALAASIIGRILQTKAYEHIGTLSVAAFNYLGHILSVALPIFILGEHVSWQLVVGAILIVGGLILTHQHHAAKLAHKHTP